MEQVINNPLVAAVIGSAITMIGYVISAKISSRQKENQKTITQQEEKIKSLNERLIEIQKAESKYLDIIKEWSGETKKAIKEQVANSISQK